MHQQQLAQFGKHTARKKFFRNITNAADHLALLNELRSIMRQSAQPVTVITVGSLSAEREIHGATLSSFSSIAFSPVPIISFSLRLPSRMAERLMTGRDERIGREFCVNILSSSQSSVARRFSRPDLYPRPFEGGVGYRIQEEIPLLDDCVGSLICEVLKTIKLEGRGCSTEGYGNWDEIDERFSLSQLFLARVKQVRMNGNDLLPLVYHNGQYTTVR